MIGLGAPILGGALGGPLGAAAGKILADALGATKPTPAAVNAAIEQAVDPNAAVAAAQRAESEWLTALAEIGKAQVAEVGATQRAEIASDDPLQRWWRPLYALELSLLECPAFALTLLHALWIGHDAGHQRLCQPVRPFHGLFWRSFRRFGRLCHRPDAGKAGRRDRGTAADPDRRIAQGAPTNKKK